MKISRDKSFILAILIGSSALSPASLLYGASVSQNTPANCNQTGLTLALTAGAGVTVYGALKLREEYIRHGYIQTVYYLKHILMPDDKFEQKILKYALSGLKHEESQQLKMLYVAQVKNADGRIIFTNYVNELITRYKKLASGAEFENNSTKTGWVSTFEAYAAQPVKDVCNGYKKNDYTQTAKGALTLGSCGLALAGMCYVDAVSILLNVFGLLKNKEPYSGGSNSSNNDPRDAQVDIGFDEAIAKSLQYQELEEIDQKNLNRAITCSLDDQKGLPKNPPVSNGPSDQGAASGNNDKEASGPGSAKAIALKATDDIANDISRKHRQQKNRAKKNRNAARKKNKTNEKNNTKLMSDPYAPRRGNKARKGKSAINSGARSGFESFNENGNRKVGRNPFELLASASDSDDKADKKNGTVRDRSHVNLARDYSSDGESTNFEENVPPKITLGDFIIHKKPQRRDGQKNQNNSKTSAVVDTKAAYHASSHTNTQDAQNVDAFNQEQPEQEQLDDMPMDAKEVKKNNKKFHKPNRKDKEPQKRRAARSSKPQAA